MTGHSHLLLAAAAASMATPAAAQLRPPMNGDGIGDYTLHDFASKWMMQQDDVPEIEKYRAENDALRASGDQRPRIVQFGDSITAHWDLTARDDNTRHFVNRGIGGQNSSQMLLRFHDDVSALAPDVVVILAGTNDLRAYVGDPASVAASALARIGRNIVSMADIAEGRGIAVVLSTVPPVGADRERVARDGAAIAAVNEWIRAFAAERGYPVADYHRALADRDILPTRWSDDGVHPNAAGYAVMWPVLETALSTLPARARR